MESKRDTNLLVNSDTTISRYKNVYTITMPATINTIPCPIISASLLFLPPCQLGAAEALS